MLDNMPELMQTMKEAVRISKQKSLPAGSDEVADDTGAEA